MINEIKLVKEFYKAFDQNFNKEGIEFPSKPKLIDRDRVMLRQRLIDEETYELKEAVLFEDMTEIADAIGDSLYILFGTAIEYGIADKLPAIFKEIHDSNMSKLGEDGKPIYRYDGKIMKGPGYRKPEINKILTE